MKTQTQLNPLHVFSSDKYEGQGTPIQRQLTHGAVVVDAAAAENDDSHPISGKTLAAELNQLVAHKQGRVPLRQCSNRIMSADALTQALHSCCALPRVRLEDFLINKALLTKEQLNKAKAIAAETPDSLLADVLVGTGVISARQIQLAHAQMLGIPCVDVQNFVIDPATLALVDSSIAIKHQALPLMLDGDDTLVIAVGDPLISDFIQEIRFVSGLNVVPVIADPAELRVRILKAYSLLDNARARLTAKHNAETSRQGRREPSPLKPAQVNVEDLTHQLAREAAQSAKRMPDNSIEDNITDSAMVKLVNKIIAEAHAQNASDIHIECNASDATTRIRFRKDGDLEDYLDLEPAYRNALVSRIKIMAGLDISEHRHSQDGKIEFAHFGSVPIELRVAIIPTANGREDVVLRILGGVEPLPIDQLGFSKRDLDEMKQMVTHSNGLILVCGPTGSGKTTTLHSILHYINRPDLKIWTAEDPIEISQPGLRQVQINAKIGWTFAAAMRSFLRADPDVIMVGEMRDAETTKIGIEASLTGHLVFSTLHTNSAAESVVRLLELGMDPFNFADALIGILSQRLARKLCPKCKRAHTPNDDELLSLAQEYCNGTVQDPAVVTAHWRAEYGAEHPLQVYEAVGCDACTDGYRGRIGVYELLLATPEIKQLIRSHGTVPQIVSAGHAAGMALLKQDAIEKVLQGLLDLNSARIAAS